MLTSGNDYFVCEGRMTEVLPTIEFEGKKGKEFEQRGTGVNAMTYWVTNNILTEWEELPDITPSQLQVAKK